jgi:alkylation response protein AidB-like acyl-CoA dehydrogenase
MRRYPYNLIDERIVTALRNDAGISETNGFLSEAQMSVVHEQQWLKIFVPRAFGGLELSLPEAVRLEEEIAHVDGSIGWTVTLCGGASLFVGFLQPGMRKEITDVTNLCIAGSGMDTGTARVASNGYYVSGSWPYATGAHYADYFTANCVVEGTGEVKSFIFRRNEVQVQNTWNLFGMKATASHTFSVKSLRRNAARCPLSISVFAACGNYTRGKYTGNDEQVF